MPVAARSSVGLEAQKLLPKRLRPQNLPAIPHEEQERGLLSRASMFIKRILVPVDFSRRSSPALAFAIGVAQESGASIDVLYVLPAPSGLSVVVDVYTGRPLPHPSAAAIVDARDQMDSLFASVNHCGTHLRPRIEAGDPAATIVRVATEEAADLIVIGTHGRTGIAGLILGSVAKTVLGCAPCPVVVLREPRAEDAFPGSHP